MLRSSSVTGTYQLCHDVLQGRWGRETGTKTSSEVRNLHPARRTRPGIPPSPKLSFPDLICSPLLWRAIFARLSGSPTIQSQPIHSYRCDKRENFRRLLKETTGESISIPLASPTGKSTQQSLPLCSHLESAGWRCFSNIHRGKSQSHSHNLQYERAFLEAYGRSEIYQTVDMSMGERATEHEATFGRRSSSADTRSPSGNVNLDVYVTLQDNNDPTVGS